MFDKFVVKIMSYVFFFSRKLLGYWRVFCVDINYV